VHDELDDAEHTRILEQHYQEIRDLKNPLKMTQIETEDKGAREVPASSIPSGSAAGEDKVKGTRSCKLKPSATSKPRQAMPTQKSSKAKNDREYRKKYFNS
jgi:hypothetical protein